MPQFKPAPTRRSVSKRSAVKPGRRAAAVPCCAQRSTTALTRFSSLGSQRGARSLARHRRCPFLPRPPHMAGHAGGGGPTTLGLGHLGSHPRDAPWCATTPPDRFSSGGSDAPAAPPPLEPRRCGVDGGEARLQGASEAPAAAGVAATYSCDVTFGFAAHCATQLCAWCKPGK